MTDRSSGLAPDRATPLTPELRVQHRGGGRLIRWSAGGLIAVALVGILSTNDKWVQIYVAATILLAMLYWGIRQALQRPAWFVFGLILVETVPYFNIIPLDPNNRWFLRYPLLFPLALPALWAAIKSRKLFDGRFGLMLCFFSWSAFTVVYSLNPAVSLGRLVPDFLLFGTICFAASRVESATDVQVILGRFVLGCGLLQIFTAFAYLFLPEVLGGSGPTLRATWMVDESGLYRFCGVFNEPNAIGSLMLATVGAGVAHWHSVRTKSRKLLLALSMTSAVIFAVVADSRSETAVTALGCGAYLLWKHGWRGVIALALALMIAGAAYSMFSSSVDPYLNRGLTTMTGRTEAWSYEMTKAIQSPLLGYGYQSEGEILRGRDFRDWEEIWNQGADTPLHNGYMTLAIGVGVPAAIFWLAVFIGPWWCLFRGRDDPWNLIPLALLVTLPALLLSIDESGLSEPRYVRGLLLFMSWALAERYNIVHGRHAKESADPKLSPSRWAMLFEMGR